jgi:hypothetical protein
MFTVHHGLADSWNVPDMQAALNLTALLLGQGKHNVLITRAETVVTGRTDYDDKREDGRIGTNVLEVGIMPPETYKKLS